MNSWLFIAALAIIYRFIADFCWAFDVLHFASFQIIVGCIPDYLLVRWVLYIAAFQVLVIHSTLYFAESSIIYCRTIAHDLLLISTLFIIAFQIDYF